MTTPSLIGHVESPRQSGQNSSFNVGRKCPLVGEQALQPALGTAAGGPRQRERRLQAAVRGRDRHASRIGRVSVESTAGRERRSAHLDAAVVSDDSIARWGEVEPAASACSSSSFWGQDTVRSGIEMLDDARHLLHSPRRLANEGVGFVPDVAGQHRRHLSAQQVVL